MPRSISRRVRNVATAGAGGTRSRAVTATQDSYSYGEPQSSAMPLCARACCQFLPRLASLEAMSTMNISLPDALKEFVEGQVAERGYGTSSEYVRELIRKDRDRQSLRALVMEGARSAPASPADAAYFDDLRSRIRHADGW